MPEDPDQSAAPNPVPSAAPNQRSFSLNSPEFYEAVCPGQDQPWIANGALPREPRVRDREVIVERRPTNPLAR